MTSRDTVVDVLRFSTSEIPSFNKMNTYKNAISALIKNIGIDELLLDPLAGAIKITGTSINTYKVGIGISNNPEAYLTIRAGNIAGAPLKFISSFNSYNNGLLTIPEPGAVEYEGTNLFFTPTTLAGRCNVLLNGYGYTGGQTVVGGTAVTDTLKLQGTSGIGAPTSPAIQAVVGNNGATTAWTVLNNGWFGIGLTPALGRLDVAPLADDGSNAIVVTGSTTHLGMIVLSQETLNTGTIKLYSGTGTPTLGVQLSGGSANSYINGGGWFGIGTDEPQGNLDILAPQVTREITPNPTGTLILRGYGDRTANYGASIIFKAPNTTEINSPTFAMAGIYGVAETTDVGGGAANGALCFHTSAYFPAHGIWHLEERMRISAAGYVGIGTTSPASLLSVGNNAFNVDENGAVVSYNSVGHVFFTGHQSGTSYNDSINAIFEAITDNDSATDSNTFFRGIKNSAVTFSVRSAGIGYFADSVGIGTSNPSSKLQVVGLSPYTSNTAAKTAGLSVGAFYYHALDNYNNNYVVCVVV